MISSAASSSAWLKLSHKTAIVTGAASGIGAAVCRALALEQSCRHIVLVDRNADKLGDMLRQTNQQLATDSSTNEKPLLTSIACNVGNEDEVQDLMQSVFRGEAAAAAAAAADDEATTQPPATPSILINCAGITRDSLVTKMTMEQWNDVMNVNLTGTFYMCRQFIQRHAENNLMMGKNGSNATTASIVNVGSVVATHGNVGQANYAASKGGVVGLTKALAKECAATGGNIRVNAVMPGFIQTEMVQAIPDKVKAQILPKIALQKMGQPADVANLILFLASSERAGYITGECIECSGMIAL